MNDRQAYARRGVVGRHEETFHDVLYLQMARTPWWLISIGAHAVVLVALWSMSFTPDIREDEAIFMMGDAPPTLEDLIVDEKPPEVKPIDPPEEMPPDPTIIDELVEEFESDVEDESLDPDDQPVGPFEGDGMNKEIGIGAGPGGGGTGLRGRRKNRLKVEGGAPDATEAGLEWLRNHQDPEGYWDCDGFEAQCKFNKCGGAGHALWDPGVSGLALLAFLGAGETHKTGHYQETVRKGLRYLKRIQDPEGCFGPRTDSRFTYAHSVAALAMIEAYGMTGSALFKTSAQNSIDFIERCRNPYLAWRYGVRPQDNDTSVTGWMVMALKSAKLAGNLRVPDSAFDGARAWIEKVTEPEYGKVGYTARGNGPARPQDIMDQFPADKSEALTAVGILTRMFLGEKPDSEMVQKGADLCLRSLPEWDEASGSIDMYYWYYGSLALFQVGGDRFRAWNAAMKPAIVDHQRQDGDQKGSWDPVGPWGREGGRVYSTALCTLCLEVYYRYEQVHVGSK